MSDLTGGRTDRAAFDDQLAGEVPFAEAAGLERMKSIVATGARDGTLATMAGTLLLWRAVRSLRRGDRNVVPQAVTGIVALSVGLRQRRLDAGSTEERVDALSMDEWDRLNGGNVDEDENAAGSDESSSRDDVDRRSESTPNAEGESQVEHALGGDLPGERLDPEFSADAETQAQPQPSLSADIHDPRRDAGSAELDPSETALPDDTADAADSSSSAESDRSAETDEGTTGRAANGSESADDGEDGMDEDGGPTESSGDEHAEDESEARTGDADGDEESENDGTPEGEPRQDETDPDAGQARDGTDEDEDDEDEEADDGTIPEGGMRQDETDPDAT